MNPDCPRCRSTRVVTLHVGRKTCGALGTAAGAATGFSTAVSGARVGAAAGLIAGPAGPTLGGIAGAIVGGLVGGFAGGSAGAAVGVAVRTVALLLEGWVAAAVRVERQQPSSRRAAPLGWSHQCVASGRAVGMRLKRARYL